MSSGPIIGTQPARNFVENYDFVSILGAGGFSKVFLYKYRKTYQLRAVKLQVYFF